MNRERGFTLIEVLVAVMIAAILAVMAFGAMREALEHREVIKTRGARLAAVQATMRTFVQDFSQIVPRPVREPLGAGYKAAVAGAAGATPVVEFTRGGWTNPAGSQRSSLERVSYALTDGVLYRYHWLVLDPQLQPEPVRRTLLDGVQDFQVEYMDDSRSWQASWPPQTSISINSERQLRSRPIAVRITVTLQDWGTLVRVIEVAG
jgi:general secretion pathway protein J